MTIKCSIYHKKAHTIYSQCGQEVEMETFNVEIQCQHLLRLLMFSFQTAVLKHLSCRRPDRLWQTTVSQSSSSCQWLKALLSAWRAVGRRLCDRPNFHTDQSPFAPLPAQPVMSSSLRRTYASMHKTPSSSALFLALRHQLKQFTFLLLSGTQCQTC